MSEVPILYFTDVLCVWAYIAELRLNEVRARFGGKVRIEARFCSVFGHTARKMATAWADRGGYEGFNAHLRHAVEAFPEMTLNPDLWLTVRPASSNPAHLFLKALALAEAAGDSPAGGAERAASAVRRAFFTEGRDIARQGVLTEVARDCGVDPGPALQRIEDGAAFAALAGDYQDAEAMGVQGSPSFVLNNGRQKLYGNVGYRIIEANILELLRAPSADQASWC